MECDVENWGDLLVYIIGKELMEGREEEGFDYGNEVE